jgi:hypothetical protein
MLKGVMDRLVEVEVVLEAIYQLIISHLSTKELYLYQQWINGSVLLE